MNWKMTWGIYIYYLYIEYRLAHFEKKNHPARDRKQIFLCDWPKKYFLITKKEPVTEGFIRQVFCKNLLLNVIVLHLCGKKLWKITESFYFSTNASLLLAT